MSSVLQVSRSSMQGCAHVTQSWIRGEEKIRIIINNGWTILFYFSCVKCEPVTDSKLFWRQQPNPLILFPLHGYRVLNSLLAGCPVGTVT